MSREKVAEEIGKTVQSELDWATKRGKKNVVTVFNLEEANLIIEVMGKMKKEKAEVTIHDQTEYAFRNGYDRALDDFIAKAEEYSAQENRNHPYADDFGFGQKSGIDLCIDYAKELKARNNGEK